MHASINHKIAINIKKQKNQSNNGRSTGGEGEEEEEVVYLSRGPLSKPAVRKTIKKLLKYGLIEKVALNSETLSKESLNKEEVFNFKLRRAKPFKITDYGLFCILSHEIEYPVELFSKYWKRKVLTTLLSPYFEKRSILHASPYVHFAVLLYLNKACSITNNALNRLKETAAATTIDGNAENDDIEQERRDIVARLQDDLDWHAKSFALRLLAFPAGRKKHEQRNKRIRILMDLASDKKFSKLLKTSVHEIQATYEGLIVSRRHNRAQHKVQ